MLANDIRRNALAVLSSMCLTMVIAAWPAWGQGSDIATRRVPGPGKIEFENDSIAVVRIRMAPHEKTPMHDIATARLVIWLTDVHLKDTGADGSVSEIKRVAGAIDWVTPRRHMGENLSDNSLEFLAIVPKVAPATHGGHPH